MNAERRPADLGTRLKEARLAREISLRSISDVTRIAVAVLESLERNDVSKLPGGIFSRSVVRAYAREVGLDPEATVADFVAQFPDDLTTVGHVPSSIGWEEMQEAERRSRLRRKVLTLVVAALLVAVGAVQLVSRTALPASVAHWTGGAFARLTSSAQAVWPLASSPAAPAGVNLDMVATRACSVSVIADGGTPETFVLVAGDRRQVSAVSRLTVTLSEADAVAMIINGAAARAPGAAGERVVMDVTPANYRQFLEQP